MSKFVAKFRKNKNYNDDNEYESKYLKEKKRSKNERSELRKLKQFESEEYYQINKWNTR